LPDQSPLGGAKSAWRGERGWKNRLRIRVLFELRDFSVDVVRRRCGVVHGVDLA